MWIKSVLLSVLVFGLTARGEVPGNHVGGQPAPEHAVADAPGGAAPGSAGQCRVAGPSAPGAQPRGLVAAQTPAQRPYYPQARITGTGLDHRVPRGTPRPDKATLRVAADRDAQTKCDLLFGPSSKIEVTMRPRYFESSDPGDSQVDATYDGDYLCTSGTGDHAAIVQRLMGLILHPSSYGRKEVSRMEDYATWQLGLLGDEAVPSLLQALQTSHPRDIENHLYTALENTRSSCWDVIEAFLKRLNSADEFDAEDAAEALHEFASIPGVDGQRLMARVRPILDSGNEVRRGLASEVLSGFGKGATSEKERLWQVIEQNVNAWLPPNPTDALAEIGVGPEDLPRIQRLVAQPDRSSAQKGDLIRLLGLLAPGKGGIAVPYLLSLISVDYAKATGIFDHAPFVEAVIALRRIGLTGDTDLDGRVLSELRQLVDSDHLPGLEGVARDQIRKTIEAYERPAREAREQQARNEHESQVRSKVARLEDGHHSVDEWISALHSPETSVRWAAVDGIRRLDKAAVFAKLLPLFADADPLARAGALEVVRDMGKDAASAKDSIFGMIRRYPAGDESGTASIAEAVEAAGLVPADLPTLRGLLALPDLGPKRRASVLRLISDLGPSARPALADVLAGVPSDLLQWTAEKASDRTNPVDGDVYLAIIALGKIGPSDDTALNTAVLTRLRSYADVDDFNVSAWVQEEVRKTIAVFDRH